MRQITALPAGETVQSNLIRAIAHIAIADAEFSDECEAVATQLETLARLAKDSGMVHAPIWVAGVARNLRDAAAYFRRGHRPMAKACLDVAGRLAVTARSNLVMCR